VTRWNCARVIPLAAALPLHKLRAVGVVITLIVAGAVLLLLETVLPGLIAGILGLICLIAAIIQSYIEFGPETGTYVLFGVVAALIAGTIIWVKVFPQTRFARVFTSNRTVGDINTERPELLHQTGSALTPLRPSGTALINGNRVDVVTEGSMIDRNTPVKVVAVEGMRVVVRALSETPAQPTT
jgi:membrane-bound serine protease (ClpP class)